MPSSDEIFQKQAEVREWYVVRWLMEKHGYPRFTAEQTALLIPYETQRETYIKETGAYTGPYSAL